MGASGKPDAELINRTFNVANLCELVGWSRDKITRFMRDVEKDDDRGWMLTTFVAAVEAKSKGQEMKGRQRQDEIKAEQMADDLARSRGELLERSEVIRAVSEYNKLVVESFSGMSDELERECSPGVDVLESLDAMCEERQEKLYGLAMGMFDG